MLPEGLCQIRISNDTIGNRTRDLLTCSEVPQATAPPHAHLPLVNRHNLQYKGLYNSAVTSAIDEISVPCRNYTVPARLFVTFTSLNLLTPNVNYS